MQNAAFAARGLDWHYAAFDVDDVVAAVRALRTLGFAGANVTIPHKQAVVAACDEADGDAVNTLVFRDGRVLGSQHRPRDPRRHRRDARVRDRRRRRGARARAGAARATRASFSRRGEWPPDATGCDLIVNATPVRDELLVVPQAGQTVVDLAYGAEETALVAAARAAGCTVIDGREALVRQGAASFRALDGARAAGRRDARGGQALDQASAPPASAARPPQAQSRRPTVSRPLCCGSALTTGPRPGLARRS